MKSTKFLFLATKKALAAKLGLFVDRDLVAFEGLKPLVSILESLFYGVILDRKHNRHTMKHLFRRYSLCAESFLGAKILNVARHRISS